MKREPVLPSFTVGGAWLGPWMVHHGIDFDARWYRFGERIGYALGRVLGWFR